MMICNKWGNTDIKWKNSNWTWAECRLVEEIIQEFEHVGIDASKMMQEEETFMPFWMKDNVKKKRLIRLICKIKKEEFDETKEVKDIKISIDDIKLTVKVVSGIELRIK